MDRYTISKASRLNLDMYSLKDSSSLCFTSNKLIIVIFDFLLLSKCAMNYCANYVKELIEFGFKMEYQFHVAFLNVKGKDLLIISSEAPKNII